MTGGSVLHVARGSVLDSGLNKPGFESRLCHFELRQAILSMKIRFTQLYLCVAGYRNWWKCMIK